MNRPESKYVERDGKLFVRVPRVRVDRERGSIVTEVVEVKGGPFDRRRREDLSQEKEKLKKGEQVPRREPPQELAQNE